MLTDLNDSAPTVTHRREGLNEIVTVDCDAEGPGRARLRAASQDHARSTVGDTLKIRKELLAPEGSASGRFARFPPSLLRASLTTAIGKGLRKRKELLPFSFGSNIWGKLRLSQPSDQALDTRYVPRSMIFADAGVEGLEWFVGSDLSQWDVQLTGAAAAGPVPAASPVRIRRAWHCRSRRCRALTRRCLCRMPASLTSTWRSRSSKGERTGRGCIPRLTATVASGCLTEEIRRWAEKGIQTVHCHNDGDYYGDGLFWRDGVYPPYPDMDRYDKVLADCRQVGIRTATYFSNKELHPSTKEFQEHGEAWGRMNRKGELQHNYYRADREFGAQMCLRSGWLDFLKFSIDRVLKNHPLDGVYFDWNVALLCCNPLHEAARDSAAPAKATGTSTNCWN